MKRIQPLALVALFLFAACSEPAESIGAETMSPPPVDASIVDTNTAATDEKTVQPDAVAVKPSGPAIDLNAFWGEDVRGVDMLNGTWAESAQDCAQGLVLVFETDIYRDLAGGGRWQVSGNEIRIDYRTAASGAGGVLLENEMVYRVLALAPDSLHLTDDNRGERRLQLCD